MTDYRNYKFKKSELIKYYLIGNFIFFILLWMFFRSIFISSICLILAIFYIKLKGKYLNKKRQIKLQEEFIDLLQAVGDALKTGNSLERAFISARNEVEKINGKNSMIYEEVNIIINKLNMNIPIEKSIEDLASRSGINEIKYFSEVISIAKKRGGNIIKMVSDCSDTLMNIIETKKEIEVIIAGKVNEKKIMDKIPLFIIFYISLTSPEIMQPLYTTLYGRFIMIFSLLGYIFAYYLGERIVNIKI